MVLSIGEFGGILIVEEPSPYETTKMSSFRAWKIAEAVDGNRKIKKKELELLRKTTHLTACKEFISCTYS